MSEAAQLNELVRDVAVAFHAAAANTTSQLEVVQFGTVTQVEQGTARVSGLPDVGAQERVEMAGAVPGVAFNLDPDHVGVVLLDDSDTVQVGTEVRASGRQLDTPVGETLLGRVVDALGRPLDGGGPVVTTERWPIERDAPTIAARAPVNRPLQTGIKVVDALFPIGRGQRELILGDRQTGKTAIAVDAMINQPDDVVCIYCAIGQQATGVARVVDKLRVANALHRCIIIVAPGESVPGLQYITPYAAMTVAEYFMEHSTDVLLVLDDLTRHARAYRELSLLLRRPPGREAYPGDIFYLHSRLLERSASVRDSATITALPIVETQAQDIAAYIPTNLISITDGQLYLSPQMARRGIMPAVDVGRSVSRVGGKAQLPAYRAVAGDLRLAYAQFEELESFSRFATRLDAATRATVERGQRVREVFRQREGEPLPVLSQIAILRAVNSGVLDDLSTSEVAIAEHRLQMALVDEVGLSVPGSAPGDGDLATLDRLTAGVVAEIEAEHARADT